MSCDHDWTIRFRRVNDDDPFEIRPKTMSLKKSRTDYDFCRATVPWEVGEEMKPHTRSKDGALHGQIPVDICYSGDPIQRLMFRPDWVDYAEDETHLQFHDLHKSMMDGEVDMEVKQARLKPTYERVLNQVNNNLISEVKSSGLPNDQVRQVIGQGHDGSNFFNRNQNNREEIHGEDPYNPELETKRTGGKWAIDFNKITPEEAIHDLNEMFNIKSWVNYEGTLIIGLPEDNEMRHIAAPNDERVWRYKDPNISHGREPIKAVRVQGAWEDEPGLDFDVTEWFDEGGTADARVYGFAERDDVDYGTTVSLKAPNVGKDNIGEAAVLAMKEQMKQTNAGTIEIDPELSGSEIDDPINLKVGDVLHIVPRDEWFDNPTKDSGTLSNSPDDPEKLCGGFIHNEAYFVSEVEHSISEAGDWQIFADIGLNAEDIEQHITPSIAYYEPEDEAWYGADEFMDGGLVEGQGGIF